jgi:hypothetical protein
MNVPQFAVGPEELLAVVQELYPAQCQMAFQVLEVRKLKQFIEGLPEPQPKPDPDADGQTAREELQGTP